MCLHRPSGLALYRHNEIKVVGALLGENDVIDLMIRDENLRKMGIFFESALRTHCFHRKSDASAAFRNHFTLDAEQIF